MNFSSYVPLTAETYWQVNMKSMTIDGTDVCGSSSGCKAVIDSGTSLITGPTGKNKLLFWR